MARGGKRQNSGRKANPTKDVSLAQKEAEKLLKALEKRKSLEEIYGTCGDARIQTMINLKVREWAGQGAAAERTELTGKDGGPVQIQLVNHVPRPSK